MVPCLSIVIPVLNESGNVAPLVREISGALDKEPSCKGRYEVIFVDDGSTDSTTAEIAEAMQTMPHVRMLRHSERQGMSTAVRHGVMAARAPWIMTCDGDGQNDPADMPRLLALGWARGMDDKILVCGVRINRQDSRQKRLASRSANRLRRWVLQDGAPDTGCALKLFRRDGYLAIPFFTSLHRFMPAMFRTYGHEVIHTPVYDRPRLHGESKSDILGRAGRGLYDLIGVKWLMQRSPRVQVFTEYRPAQAPAQVIEFSQTGS